MSSPSSSPRRAGHVLAMLGVLAAGLLLAAAVWLYRGVTSFDNPVAFAFCQGRLYVVERSDNRLLEFDLPSQDAPLRLLRSRAIEPDESPYYFMVRNLFRGPAGLVVQSHVYERKTERFVGYRFQEYSLRDLKPLPLLTVFLDDSACVPEFKYAWDAQGRDYFVHNCAGHLNLWRIERSTNASLASPLPVGKERVGGAAKVPVAGPVVYGHKLPAFIHTFGETNTSMSHWMAMTVHPTNGHIFVSSGSADIVIEYDAQGQRLKTWGTAGFLPGQLLAPTEIDWIPNESNGVLRLVVASSGNRSWVAFDATGQVERTLLPLSSGYPFPDVLVGAVHRQAGTVWAFDLVNKGLVRHIAQSRVYSDYGLTRPGVALWLALASGLCLVIGLTGRRWHAWLMRRRIPMVLKLLALFIPLLVASALIVGDQTESEMQDDLSLEIVRRSQNLARAVVNTLDPRDLEAIRVPTDRDSPVYERVYKTIARLIDRDHVEKTPKWILHKIRDGRYYFGVSIWRGPVFEPFIVPTNRVMFFNVLQERVPQYSVFRDEQGEWFSYVTPLTNNLGLVTYVLELYVPTEALNRAKKDADARILQSIGGTVFVAVLLVLAFSYYTMRPLRELMRATTIVSTGQFDQPIRVRSRDELHDLALAFNAMMVNLKQYTRDLARATAEQERMHAELQFAKEVQQGLLPTAFPPFDGARTIDIFARMEPAREIGGDYYDFFLIDEHRFGVAIGDVSDKGVPAGLFMVGVRSVLRSCAAWQTSAADVLARVNRQLADDNPSAMFVTLIYFICDMKTGTIDLCNAGHLNPVLIRHDGPADWLPNPEAIPAQLVLGVMEESQYRAQSFRLAPGESLVLYTDGVTEAVDRQNAMFGEARLLERVRALGGKPGKDLADGIVADVMSYQAGLAQHDDITLLVFKYKG